MVSAAAGELVLSGATELFADVGALVELTSWPRAGALVAPPMLLPPVACVGALVVDGLCVVVVVLVVVVLVVEANVVASSARVADEARGGGCFVVGALVLCSIAIAGVVCLVVSGCCWTVVGLVRCCAF